MEVGHRTWIGIGDAARRVLADVGAKRAEADARRIKAKEAARQRRQRFATWVMRRRAAGREV